MTFEELGEVMAWIADGEDEADAAARWVSENPEKVESWIDPVMISE